MVSDKYDRDYKRNRKRNDYAKSLKGKEFQLRIVVNKKRRDKKLDVRDIVDNHLLNEEEDSD